MTRRGRRGRQRALPAPQTTGRITAHEVQAAAEGVVVTDGKVELRGRMFRHATALGAMPLITLAKISKQGVDANSVDGMVAIHDLLFDCIEQGSPACGECEACTAVPARTTECDAYDPGDWEAFRDHANRHKCEGDELMGVAKAVIASLARGRTASPGGSASSSRPTSPSSRESWSPRDTATSSSVPAHTSMPEPPGGFIDVDTLSDR